jgi:hypothetical protein
MPRYVQQLCFVLLGLPPLLALIAAASGQHGALPLVAVLFCWLSVQLTRNFMVETPNFRTTLLIGILDENLYLAGWSAIVSVALLFGLKLAGSPTLTGIRQVVNLCVLGWWLAFAAWNLLLANVVSLPERSTG